MLWILSGYVAGACLFLPMFLFLLTTIYIAHLHYKYSHIPSPKRSSFYYGHAADILQVSKEMNNPAVPFTLLVNIWYEDVGTSTFVVFLLFRAVVITVDPEVVKEVIMNSENSKPPKVYAVFQYLFGERFLGNGLLTSINYETWKPRRKLYDPAFNKTNLKSLITTFNACTDDFLKKLEPMADGKSVVPMPDLFGSLTMDIISKAAFGADFATLWDAKSLGIKSCMTGENVFIYLIKKVAAGAQVSLRTLYPPLYQFLHPFETRGYQEAVRAMRKIGRDCIMKRVKTIENGEQPPNDILTHILKVAISKEAANIEDLVDDFCTYYSAGTETTSILLSFAIFALHDNPEVLERLIAEINDVLGDKKEVTAEDVEKLQYTEQVLYETLRLYPPVFGVTKQLHCKNTLGGYSTPKTVVIQMMTATMCRMPQYFNDPDVFDPSRFNPENKKPNTFAYFPFGLGRRSCIGRHFAMMEAKIVLARLIQTYKITLPEDFQLVQVQRTTLQPKDLPCTLLPRL